MEKMMNILNDRTLFKKSVSFAIITFHTSSSVDIIFLTNQPSHDRILRVECLENALLLLFRTRS